MQQEKEREEPRIVFQDKFILVLNKPSGWVVNDAKTVRTSLTVQGWLRHNFQFPIFNFQECRNGIVHRLDKETSGILLVAKDKRSFEFLQNEFKEGRVSKEYLALLHGKALERGEIEVTVGRLPWRRDRFGILPDGRRSETIFERVALYTTEREIYSLVRFAPKTGRTHQIRIHAKYIGHPIVSDSFYAGRKTARRDRMWCTRLFLHASKIKFNHPDANKVVEFEVPLPTDLESVLSSLRHSY